MKNRYKRFFLRRDTVICVVVASVALAANVGLAKDPADWRPTERWRGFNLLGMFRAPGDTSDHRAPGYFTEDEFQWIHDWGFNFVRLPMDYRHWIVDGDWNTFDEKVFERLDKVVEWGTKYGIHVQFCFHRAPGFSVLGWEKQDKLQLRDSDVPLQAFAKQWAAFARHYRDVPNERLSFNLVNEPSFPEERYVHIAQTLIAAIRKEDPKRFIIADGNRTASRPVPGLYPVPGVGQAMRGYAPHTLTHYRVFYFPEASFKPVWPLTRESPVGGALWGRGETGHDRFTVADAPAGRWEFSFGRVDGPVTLAFAADGKPLRTVAFDPKEDDGARWLYPKKRGALLSASATESVFLDLPAPVKELTVEAVAGKVAVLGSVTVVSPEGRKATLGTWLPGGGGVDPKRNANFRQRFSGFGETVPFRVAEATGPYDLRGASTPGEGFVREFCDFMRWEDPAIAARDVFVMVGEFGPRASSPLAEVLAFTEDQLRYWKSRGWGWALWNLRGYCGVLDNGRTDVPLEDFHGHKLDRALLELLRKW